MFPHDRDLRATRPARMDRKMELWTPDQLRDQIKVSCIDDEPGVIDFDLLPSRIELGSFGRKALACRDATAVDPQHRERGGLIYYDPGTQSVVLTKDEKLQVGSENEIILTLRQHQARHTAESRMRDVRQDHEDMFAGRTQRRQPIASSHDRFPDRHDRPRSHDPLTDLGRVAKERQQREARRTVTRDIGLIHSHPVDSTFSSVDYTTFLGDTDNKLFVVAAVGGGMRALIATPETVWLMKDSDVLFETDREVQDKRFRDLRERDFQGRLAAMDPNLARIVMIDQRQTDALFRKSGDAVLAFLAEEKRFGYYIADEDLHSLRRLRVKSKTQ